MKTFTLKRKIWIWPTQAAAWHFVYVDGEVKDKIVKVAKKHHMGMIKVRATIGATSWDTSIFPHKKEDCYLLPIKKSVREKEDIFDGDEITITLNLV